MNASFDVAVIGSGPGGSVAATFLAQKGYRVVLIERETFPRFHVGESLLPATQRIWEKMGLAGELEQSGHTFKYAGEFRIGHQPDKSDFTCTTGYFHHIPQKDFTPRPYAYQVERAVFDKQLQDCAVRHGVTLWSETSVTEVLFDERGRATGMKLRRNGKEEILNTNFIIDASGRRALIANQLDGVVLDPVIKTSAVFGHFKGVSRDPGWRQGFFNGYFVPNGWIWMIPLANDVMSVGYVQNKPGSDNWSNNGEEVLLDAINRFQFVQERFKDAVQVGRVRMLKDLAYETKQFCGDGWLSVGDANFFVDPLYSSGVQVAHSTAEFAAETVDAFLKGNRDMSVIRRYENYILDYRKRVFRPMRSFYRCMRHYYPMYRYVKLTGPTFNHFDNWYFRRVCVWGTGQFHRHNWAVQSFALVGNIYAWISPKIGLGGWPKYDKFKNPNPPIRVPKAPELEHKTDASVLTAGTNGKHMPQSEAIEMAAH
ncbi:MAG: tryptophan 7-halogenase [Planctomycetaceae bacterium]|nr:tryptophan 7-halogenase [Planctomycetaceae bacterium]